MTDTTPQTWYQVALREISPVKVVKHTEKTLVLQETLSKGRTYERRTNRIAEFAAYFPTWEEAHQYLLQKSESKLRIARSNLEYAQGHYGNVKGMKKPEAA